MEAPVRLRRSVPSHIANSLIVGLAALLAAVFIGALGKVTPDRISVGDIIAFEPAPGLIRASARLSAARIPVHRPNQFGCILDLDTLRQNGGSLVAEARLASEGESYRMHWAGVRTAPDSSDCGPSADLIVERRDLGRLLAAAVGSFGGSVIPPIGATARLGRSTGL